MGSFIFLASTGGTECFGRAHRLELHEELRNRTGLRPGIAIEANPSGVRQAPRSEVFAALQLLTEQEVIPLCLVQGQTERIYKERPTSASISRDQAHAADEVYLHLGPFVAGVPAYYSTTRDGPCGPSHRSTWLPGVDLTALRPGAGSSR